jgi:hypothetical protein
MQPRSRAQQASKSPVRRRAAQACKQASKQEGRSNPYRTYCALPFFSCPFSQGQKTDHLSARYGRRSPCRSLGIQPLYFNASSSSRRGASVLARLVGASLPLCLVSFSCPSLALPFLSFLFLPFFFALLALPLSKCRWWMALICRCEVLAAESLGAHKPSGWGEEREANG